MRTFILFVMSILSIQFVYAQDIDIETIVLAPSPGFDIIAEDSFSITVGVINTGDEIIEPSDSIYLTFYIDGYLINTQEGQSFLMRRPNSDSTAQTEIAIGDTATMTFSLAVPAAYISLFENDLICFSAEIYHANSSTPVIEANTQNNTGCNTANQVGLEDIEQPMKVFTYNQKIRIENINTSSTFVLYDLYGRPILNESLTQGKHIIYTGHLPHALYLYRIIDKGRIIQHGKLLN